TASSFRSSEFPHVAVNPINGDVFVTYNNKGAGTDKADIFLVVSTNGGTNWSVPAKINDDVTTTDQWQPTIAISPNGSQVGVFYYSRQEDPANNLFKFYGRIGSVSGSTVTFDPSFAVSDVASLPEFGRDAVINSVYMGDYNHAVATSDAFHVLWADNRDDLPGGAPRKDPNVYYKRIPTTENFGWAQGIVTNLNGGAPLGGVVIDFVENVPKTGSTTDGSGFYFVGALVDTPGTTANFTLRARKFGFLDTTLAVTLTRSDTLTQNFAMTPLDLVVTKSEISFPETPVPGMSVDSLVARNQGTSPLNLSSLTTTNPDFAVSPPSATIPAGDSVTVYVTYTPAVEGVDTGRVVIISNSVYTPRKDVVLDGTGIGVPVFLTSIDSLSRIVEGGVRDSISFYVRNEGTTAGEFAARAVMFPRAPLNGAANQPIIIPMSVRRAQSTSRVNPYVPIVHPEDEFANGPVTRFQAPKTPQSQQFNELSLNSSSPLQQVPELLYYKFDETGGNATTNFASPGVGTNPAPVNGLTMGGSGQFTSALVGNGGTSGSNNVNTGWATNLGTGAWTISLWISNLPVNTTLYYLFGDVGASTFRCFIGGVAGAGGIALRGGGGPDLYILGAAPGPNVVTYTYDPALPSNQLKAYFNGALTAQATATYSISGTGMLVGGYSTVTGLPAGGLLDEFRVYNRALDAFEISSTWNIELGGGVWFSVAPTQGTVALGDSVLMKAFFDATDPAVYNDPGEYFGRLDFMATNSSLADTLRIPARMFVEPSDTGILVVDSDALEFGNVPVNAESTLTVTVRNIGAQTVNVTDINISNPNFTANPTSFTLGSLGTQDVDVTFMAPAPPGLQTGTLSFVSNAASAQTVALMGTSVGVPDFLASVDSLTQSIEGGTRDSILFYMRNNGTGSGDFVATAIMFPQTGPNGTPGKPIVVPAVVRPAKAPANNQIGWSDAAADGHDPASGVSVSQRIEASLVDPQYYNFNTGGAGNTFPFNVTAGKRIQWLYLPGDFGQPTPAPQGRITTLYFRISTGGSGTYTDLSIAMGQTTLTDLPAGDWYSGPLQPVYFRASVDLAAATGEWVSIQLDVPFAYDPSQSLVIDINQCARSGTGMSTFHTGISGVKRNASLVGASCPLPYANTSTLVAHCGIDVSGGTWFSIDPTAGTVAVGDSILMKAYFDATDPEVYNNPGNYFGQLKVEATNSDLADTLRIPVRLFVVPPAGPRMTVDVDSLAFGDVEIDSSRTLPLVVRNIGAAPLMVTGISMSDTSFSAVPTNFTLASLETLSVSVTFTAPAPGATHMGTMGFVSNDPSAPTVSLQGRSIGIANVVIQPDSFFFATSFGDSVDGTITIRNTGLGELMYSSLVVGGFVGQDSTEVGSAALSLATSSALMRGGVVQVTSSVQLNEIKSWLVITTTRELRFIVYENTSGTSFDKIFETVVASSGTGGPQWYSSGPVNVELEAGKTYAIGVNWPALTGLTYHWQASAPVPVPITFGNITGGLAQSTFPPPATITQGALTSLYYTQLVTSSSQWLNILSGGAGTVASGDTAYLGFRAYTSPLSQGNFQAAIRVQSNDPMAPTISVPVVLDIVTGLAADGALIPETYELYQNFPNPFNPTTQIKFGLPVQSLVTLKIYNVLGQEVTSLTNDVKSAGFYTMQWNGTNKSGAQISSGVYFYSLEAKAIDGSNTFRNIKKMLMLK
ncbi:MAG TPA: choice-of-anchor D domain-containing protein, partial [Bacteroidota bacterium]